MQASCAGGEASITAMFDAHARRDPSLAALITSGSVLTYGELDTAARAVAAVVAPYCEDPDSRIGLHLRRSVAFVASVLATLRAGGAFVPLDQSYPRDRLRYMCDAADVRCVITDTAEPDMVGSAPQIQVDAVPAAPADMLIRPGWEQSSEDLAAVFYTSGSTGEPKGVALPHSALYSRLPSQPVADDISNSDVFLFKSPVGFSSVLREIFWPLSIGASTVVVDDGLERDPLHLVRLIVEHQVSVIHLVPTQLRALLHTKGINRCSSLRHVIVGGESLGANTPARLFDLTGAQLHQIYGSTEATTATSHTFNRDRPESSTTIGRTANLRTFVLDTNQEPVTAGQIGEIYVGGPGLARGYLNAPELTAEKFVESNLNASGDGRLYRTGDNARLLASGVLEFAGRTDQQVKIRGNRVEVGEVSSALLGLPIVGDVVVLTQETDDGQTQLSAYLVLAKSAQEPSAEQLRALLAERLPEFMIPTAFFFLPAFPTTSIGKLDAEALLDCRASRTTIESDYAPPTTPLQSTLTELLQSALALERVGVDDDFFALGGQSLLAFRVVAQIEETTGHQLNVADVFEYPTIAELVALVPDMESAKA